MAKRLESDREQTEEGILQWIHWGNLDMDPKWIPVNPTMNWIWEFNETKMGNHCLVTCLMQLLSCLGVFFPSQILI